MRAFCAIAVVCLLAGCSGKSDISEDQLRKFVAAHKVSLEFHIGKVGRGIGCGDSGSEPAQVIEYVAAQKLGYITLKPAGKDLWQVDLTDSGRGMLKRKPYAHQVEKNCDYEQVDYALASKELVNFTGTTKDGSVVEAAYTWKWVPTEIGSQLAGAGLSNAQIADLNHALGYQVYSDDYFTFPVTNTTHPAKQGFTKEGDRWKIVVK